MPIDPRDDVSVLRMGRWGWGDRGGGRRNTHDSVIHAFTRSPALLRRCLVRFWIRLDVLTEVPERERLRASHAVALPVPEYTVQCVCKRRVVI